MPMNMTEQYSSDLQRAIDRLEIALPVPDDRLEQDEEWIVVNLEGRWHKVRLHDYNEVFAIPGLYEKWIYDVFGCTSPAKVRHLLGVSVRAAGEDPSSMKMLDLGAGNGCVAAELRSIGIERFVGVDIHPEARAAAERDRPGLYDDYIVGDLTNLDEDQERRLSRHRFGGLACVAALGFGDIPPEVFAAAFNRVEDGGWIAFTIKRDFLDAEDYSGFSVLVRRLLAGGILELIAKEEYVHRVTAHEQELIYSAFIGRRRGGITPEHLGS